MRFGLSFRALGVHFGVVLGSIFVSRGLPGLRLSGAVSEKRPESISKLFSDVFLMSFFHVFFTVVGSYVFIGKNGFLLKVAFGLHQTTTFGGPGSADRVPRGRKTIKKQLSQASRNSVFYMFLYSCFFSCFLGVLVAPVRCPTHA